MSLIPTMFYRSLWSGLRKLHWQTCYMYILYVAKFQRKIMEKRFTGNMHMYTLYPRCNVLFSKFCAAVMRSCAEKLFITIFYIKAKFQVKMAKVHQKIMNRNFLVPTHCVLNTNSVSRNSVQQFKMATIILFYLTLLEWNSFKIKTTMCFW